MRDVVAAPAMAGDIIGGAPEDWLVIGWFTPDYRPLAETFATSLAMHGAPFHLMAKPKLAGGWNTSRKPSVVLEAMDAYPGKTLVLMDVDCVVRGDIAPVIQVAGDVGITVIARNISGGGKWKHWIAAECSSRVVVFHPTAQARKFVEAWQRQIDRSKFNHDEHSMVWAFLSSPGVEFSYIDQRYSGREVAQLPDAVICHDSAHNKAKREDGVKGMLKAFERRFLRSGRTKAGKLQGEMSQVIQA